MISHRSVTGIRVDLGVSGYGATARHEPLLTDAKVQQGGGRREDKCPLKLTSGETKNPIHCRGKLYRSHCLTFQRNNCSSKTSGPREAMQPEACYRYRRPVEVFKTRQGRRQLNDRKWKWGDEGPYDYYMEVLERQGREAFQDGASLQFGLPLLNSPI